MYLAATIRDVAKKAEVSVGTVSRYLNGQELREYNKIRIEQAIEELDYKQNYIAKGLKSNRSMTIGIIINNLTDIYSTSIVTAIEKVVEKEQYSIILCDYDNDINRMESKFQFLLDKSVDGVVIFPSGSECRIGCDCFNTSDVPKVLINEDIDGFIGDKIIVDNYQASYNAVSLLINNGHKDIAIITGPEDSYVSSQRYKGYCDALRDKGLRLNNNRVSCGNFINKGGYIAAKEIFRLKKKPTALFISNYYMTLGAVMALNELNIRIPSDLSVIAFDYFEMMDIYKPSLTVIKQPTKKIGKAAANLLLKRLKKDYNGVPVVSIVKSKLINRDSIKYIKYMEG